MSILVLAPHADDETLGMGGTISKYIQNKDELHLAILTGPGIGNHPFLSNELLYKHRQESFEATKILGVKNIIYKELPPVTLSDSSQWKINKVINDIISSINPKVIYVPYFYDLHMDHSTFTYAANVACRPYLDQSSKLEKILAYETLSETNLQFNTPRFDPNVYIDITQTMDTKLKALACYESQLQSEFKPRNLKTIEALGTLRGAHIGCKYAEAFILLGQYIRSF